MTQHNVGIAQSALSAKPDDLLVAPNLGSCLGIAIYDPKLRHGGLIHCLLPMSKSDPAKAAVKPFTYVDTGLVKLLEDLIKRGSNTRDLVIIVAGGANINDEANVFEIGKKNYTILKKLLWKNNLLLRAEDVGDNCSRTISIEIGSGRTSVKARGETKILWEG